jgi:predicted enzyme related to lactoylglutathione lyase
MPKIIHFELNVKNIEKSIRFYETVFGWKFEKWDGPGDYWLITTGDESEPGIEGGLGLEEENFPSVVNMVEVDNVDEVVRMVEANGGSVLRPKHAVPGVGWLAYIKDPDEIVTGVMKEDPDAK